VPPALHQPHADIADRPNWLAGAARRTLPRRGAHCGQYLAMTGLIAAKLI